MEVGIKNQYSFAPKIPKSISKIGLFGGLIKGRFPLNSLVLISGEGGISKSLIIQNLCHELLRNRFRCVYLCVDEHPISVYQNMILANLKVKNYINSNKLIFVDCFSYKLKLNSGSNSDFPTVYIQYPANLHEILDILSNLIKNGSTFPAKSAIFIDSFTELASRYDINSSLDFIKNIRYEFCKKSFIPVFLTFHFGIKLYEDLEQIIEYHADGIFDLRYDPYYLQKGTLVKQFRIRKLKGVDHDSSWHYFKIINGKFFVIDGKKLEVDEFKYQDINEKWSEDRKY
jgi:RecA-superfamily ATPases implicated in signal transduction